MALGGEACNMIREARKNGNYPDDGDGVRVALIIILIIAVICAAVLLNKDKTEKDASEIAIEAACPGTIISETVQLTDKFGVGIPEGYNEIKIKPTEGRTNESKYLAKNGNSIYSYILTDKPDCFPDLVKSYCEGIDLRYYDLFNSTVAISTDSRIDKAGKQVYRKTFWWPDGKSTLCCVTINSYKKSFGRLDEAIKYSISRNGKSNAEWIDEHSYSNYYIGPDGEKIEREYNEYDGESYDSWDGGPY